MPSWFVGGMKIIAESLSRPTATVVISKQGAFGADIDYAMLVKIYGMLRKE